MGLPHSLCLVVIILYHCVALEDPQTEQEEEYQDVPAESEESNPAIIHWPQGIVPYYINPENYDHIISTRIRSALRIIERKSCVKFKELSEIPRPKEHRFIWLSIQNPKGVRECSHSVGLTTRGVGPKAILVIGYECMQRRDILHSLLHVLGFNDEVTHPQRDMYVRILWSNIQPKYRSLFWMRPREPLGKMTVEYDTMSIMHFHDRAYSMNGGATITPLISGLLIHPSDTLSQLDMMKLRLAFGHECNKRKVGNLIQTCQNALNDHEYGEYEEYTAKSNESNDDSSAEIVSVDMLAKNVSRFPEKA